SGKDGKLIIAKKKPAQRVVVEGVEQHVDIGWVGETEIINTEIIDIVTKEGYIPVISPIAMDVKGNALNINADTVAGDIAAALHAKKLILMTDVPGLLRDIKDKSTRLSRVTVAEMEILIDEGVISGGMIPKMRGAAAATISGVERVHIIDGSVSHSILLELFTDSGIGTMVYKDGD
ncbi:MAG: acetylglutamate kinase, partial [Methanosarcinaceae archaeon]|nr:acetylglutamate kinase [Methanosarcinaceae archaeon]